MVQQALRLTSGSIIIRKAMCDVELSWKGMQGSGKPWHVAQGERVCFYPPVRHFDPDAFGKDCAVFR
jgi:hypothetical protein